MENKINCLIFDFDGVIANTDLGRFNALNQILPKYDSELSKSMIQTDFIGLSTKSYLKQKSRILTDLQIDDIVNQRHELFFSNLSSYCIPYKNMKETIEFFHGNYDLALVTTNSKKNAEILLEHLGIKDFFKWIIGREISENKHLVKSYSLVPDKINKMISECIVIEDSNIGVDAAKREGFFCIRFDPENIFNSGTENLKVASYMELKDKVIENTHGNRVDCPASNS